MAELITPYYFIIAQEFIAVLTPQGNKFSPLLDIIRQCMAGPSSVSLWNPHSDPGKVTFLTLAQEHIILLPLQVHTKFMHKNTCLNQRSVNQQGNI